MGGRRTIHLYTNSWNEIRMLGFFFRHYDPFVDRYVFFDDNSNDGTPEVLSAHPRVEVRRFERSDPHSFVESARRFYDQVWKRSRGEADWVILTAVDEHLHHPDFASYLDRMKRAGVTAIPAIGYEMVSEAFPAPDAHLATTLTRGAPDPQWNKLNLFDPNALKLTRYAPGRHTANPTGRVVYPPADELLLLHYKHLGIEYLHPRHRLLATGLRDGDRGRGWGHQFDYTREQLVQKMRAIEVRAIDIADPDERPIERNVGNRWWH